jgi:tetratricopeptide (TPR) repeat protein
LSNNDKNYKIYQHLAWCNLQNQNIQATLDWISKAEKKEKDNADSFYIKARCYHSFNKLSEALENYNFAIEKSPSEQIYLISQAILLYQQGNYTGSFDTIIKA